DGLAEVRELADPLSLGFFLHQYGFFLLHDGDLQEASVLEQESYRLFAEFDHEGFMIGPLNGLGMIAYKRGDYHKAEELLNEALAMAKRTKFDFMEAIILGNLAKLATTLGDYVAAERHLVRSLDIGVRIANPHNLTSTLVSLAGLRAAQGQAERAAIWASLALHHPATEKHEKQEARQLLETLRNRLSPEELSKAKERGKQLDLMEVAKEILAAIDADPTESLTS
ncbi:MAG: tetratricopeptide repeat protein, partial [Trueperaceae bacterium]